MWRSCHGTWAVLVGRRHRTTRNPLGTLFQHNRPSLVTTTVVVGGTGTSDQSVSHNHQYYHCSQNHQHHQRRRHYRQTQSVVRSSQDRCFHGTFTPLARYTLEKRWKTDTTKQTTTPTPSSTENTFIESIKKDSEGSGQISSKDDAGAPRSLNFDTDTSTPREQSIQRLIPPTSPGTPMTAKIEQQFKRVVHELNLGDQLAVIVIAVFTTLILTAPYVIRKMQSSDRQDYTVTSEDPIDDLTNIFRRVWGEMNNPPDTSPNPDEASASGSGSDRGSSIDMQLEAKGAVEAFLKDILKSKALQQAALQFVVQITEAPEFRAALGRLIQVLWADLLADPETLAQLIRLLQVAIQDHTVKLAAQNLVLDLVNEPQIKSALVEMIRKLGAERQVLEATQSLLAEAAHNALSDPEILDHSMDFATDVVGDDLVQRTAGEALRKSVGHAVRPATTIVLAATGVGLMIFGIAAVGYSRSSDQEAILFESAARSLRTNASFGLMRIITWPGRAILVLFGQAKTLALSPFVMCRNAIIVLVDKTWNGLASVALFVIQLPPRLLRATGHGLAKGVSSLLDSICLTLSSFGRYVSTSTSSLGQKTVGKLSVFFANVLRSGLEFTVRNYDAVVVSCTRSIATADRKILHVYSKVLGLTEQLLRRFKVYFC